MKIFASLLLVLFLTSCSDEADNLPNKEDPVAPEPVLEWSNMTRVADTYEIGPVNATMTQWLLFSVVGATNETICAVIWETSTRAAAACRDLIEDGQWPITCSISVYPLVECPEVLSPVDFWMRSGQTVRVLTAPEAELADELRRKSRCTATRLDGSDSPCQVS